MLTRFPDYYEQFQCLADQCPDTCCGKWDISVDADAKERFMSMEGPLGELLRAHLVTSDDETCIVPVQGHCPMLTESNLCSLILEHGKEALCTTCAVHPRFTEVYGSLQEITLDISCPKAADLLLDRQAPLAFSSRTDLLPPEPHDLDPVLFPLLTACRDTAISIMQDRSRPISDRLALLLSFSDRLDRNLSSPAVCRALCQCYSAPLYRRRQLVRMRRLRSGGTTAAIRQLLLSMEHMDDRFSSFLSRMEHPSPEQFSVAAEQLTVHYIFRWWLKAACDSRLWPRTAGAAVGVLTVCAISHCAGGFKEAARIYTKEVEHSQDNLELLYRAMELPYFSLQQLLSLLEVPYAV